MGDISTNFSYHEFRCRCGICSLSNGSRINIDFVMRLQKLREIWDQPMIPSSGCRCVKHNRAVGGALNSYHLLAMGCLAADFPITADERMMFVKLALNMRFTVGISDNFVHLDIRKRQRLFLY